MEKIIRSWAKSDNKSVSKAKLKIKQVWRNKRIKKYLEYWDPNIVSPKNSILKKENKTSLNFKANISSFFGNDSVYFLEILMVDAISKSLQQL